MTNEEAFEKWAIDYGLDYEPSFTRYDVEASWQAAIAYMQEQDKLAEQSEPVTYLKFYSLQNGLDIDEGFEEVSEGTPDAFPVYTTPQRQQPLKRLSLERVMEIYNEMGDAYITDIAIRIMDEIERINK